MRSLLKPAPVDDERARRRRAEADTEAEEWRELARESLWLLSSAPKMEMLTVPAPLVLLLLAPRDEA